ncbi:uncharacterized protein F5147DRAFT_818993 [Suillus discolor]|uniref:RNA helicase n=1 Tax=Suillus discolor TaxID=1912936 RepID=A0A9P7JPI4_9AGAM|nr:uncharacterized protein F5147DRAFT_818993 [Suillus discolor]KAG2095709.1 hypothetical protein F5147DRAFT_818993 [Suillus discolor]
MRGESHPHPSNPGLTRHGIIPAANPRVTPNTPVPEPPPRSSKRDGYSRVTVLVDEANVLFDPDFQESTRMLLGDIAAARGSPVSVIHSSALSSTLDSETTTTTISYPFNSVLTSATIPAFLATYLSNYHASLTCLASPRLHHLPPTLRTEHTSWTGGNKNADIERRIRRVWAEDVLVHSNTATGSGPVKLSKLLVFCNRRSKVEQLATFLDGHGIKCVALTGGAETRKQGSNHHLDGFLGPVPTGPEARQGEDDYSRVTDDRLLWNCVNRYVKKDGEAKIWETTLIDETWSWESVQHGDSALLNRQHLNGSLYENASQTRLLEHQWIGPVTVQEILQALSSMTSMMEQVSKERVCRRPANPIS